MVKYITFGEYNKNYKYIFLSIFFSILNYILNGFIINIFLKYKVISNNVKDLFEHYYIIPCILLLGMFIFSCILNIYEYKISKRDLNSCKSNASKSEKGCFENIKINERKKEKLNNRKNFLNILIIIIINSINLFLLDFNSILNIFDYWMFILLITSFINKKMFKLITYKHQKCAIYFNFIVVFIFESSFFIIRMNSENGKKSIYYQNIWLIPIELIIYSLLGIINSYTNSKIKLFMDLNWISLPKLLIIYSIIGFLINSIICIILTIIKCGDGTFTNYFCYIKEEDHYYMENIFAFFKKISIILSNENKSDLIFVICLFLLQILVYSLDNFFFISVLKNLYPEYFFFSNYIIDIFGLIITPFFSKISLGYYFAKEEKVYKLQLTKFILYLAGYLLAFIGFLVYLEMIELNFYGFNYYLRRYIVERSIKDTPQTIYSVEEQNESLIDDKTPNRISELSINE